MLSRANSVAAFASLSAAAMLFAPMAGAQVVSSDGKIAYVVCQSGMCDVWSMNADGSGAANLTNTPDENEFNPAWSMDGGKLAFIKGYNGVNYLYTMDADGTNPTAVTLTPSWQFGPSWSPGGTQIAVMRALPGSPVSTQFDIVIVNTDGSGERNLTNSNFDEHEPSWSPDGNKIAFAGVRFEQYPDPLTGAPVRGAQWEIVVVDIDGSNEAILSAGAGNTDRANYLEEDRAPAWSPDGSQLVFMSQAQVPSCCGPWQIWAVNRDGGGLTNVTDDATVNDMFPSWSPDGTQILFQRANGTGGYNLYTMAAPSSATVATVSTTDTSTLVSTAASTATPLTTGGNAQDADWQRNANLSQFPLTVSVVTTGKGAGGTVNSDTNGIRCGRQCSGTYAAGTSVILTAEPRKGSQFTGWSGACAGMDLAPVCEVNVNDALWVGAEFSRAK